MRCHIERWNSVVPFDERLANGYVTMVWMLIQVTHAE